MIKNTNDLSKLGYREIEMLSALLKAYADNQWNTKDDYIDGGVNWEFNLNSDNVFLFDEEYRTVMLNDDGKLENWLNCSNCGAEGFRSQVDFINDYTCKKCKDK